MFPFTPPFNQMQAHGVNGCTPQQVLFSAPHLNSSNLGSNGAPILPSNLCPYPQVPSQFIASSNQFPAMPFAFNNSNVHLMNPQTSGISMPNRPPLTSTYFQSVVSNLQHLAQTGLQNMNQMGAFHPGPLCGSNQNAAFQPSNGQWFPHLPCQNVNQNSHGQIPFQSPMGILNPTLPISWAVNPAGPVQTGALNIGNNALHLLGPENYTSGNENLKNGNVGSGAMQNNQGNLNSFQQPCMEQSAVQLPPGAGQNLQADAPSQVNTPTNINRRGSQDSGERHSPHGKFRRYETHHSGYAKSKFSHNVGNAGKGQQTMRSGKLLPMEASKNFMQKCRRAITSLTYTDEEIRKWREERKRNYPTKLNVQKKLTNKHSDIEETKMRRQELKEILVKQAELGVEVAELPPNYLSESENPAEIKQNDRVGRYKRGRFRNKFEKRGRHFRDDRHSKRQKFGQESSFKPKEPSLLEKLLRNDIKRDNSHLLQILRFVTMNSFFEEWPGKPLEFPNVTVKDGSSNMVVNEKFSFNEGDISISRVENGESGNCNNSVADDAHLGDEEDAEENESAEEATVYGVQKDSDREDNEDNVSAEEMSLGSNQKDFDREPIQSSEGEEGEITD